MTEPAPASATSNDGATSGLSPTSVPLRDVVLTELPEVAQWAGVRARYAGSEQERDVFAATERIVRKVIAAAEANSV